MKLSRTAWNNVMIISVMLMILMINVMNHRLFPDNNSPTVNASGDHLVLSAHAAILTLAVKDKFLIERVGQSWQIQSSQLGVELNKQVIEQMMMAWHQSAGLLQADSIEVAGLAGIEVLVNLASEVKTKKLTLYPLSDQLLINDKEQNRWLALPPQLYRQLLPVEIYPNQP